MSKKSEYSKKLKTKIIIAYVIDAIILLAPLLYYFIAGLISEEALVVEKVALVGTSAIALILVFINIIAKTHLRSAIWLVVLGVYIAVDNILPLIICLAVSTIVDEFVLSPLLKVWKTKYLASRTMDDRGIE